MTTVCKVKKIIDQNGLFLFFFSENDGTVEIRHLSLPDPFILGSGGDLSCDVTSGGSSKAIEDKVYSVKWYKDGREFYR